MTPEFLTVADVVELHALQLQRFGGAAGLRDQGLLESAIAQPNAGFGGVLLHPGLFEMAAAYLYHIVCNHAFIDGNKRTGLLAALVFLDLNDIVIADGTEALFQLTMAVADGRLGKAAVAEELRRLASSLSR